MDNLNIKLLIIFSAILALNFSSSFNIKAQQPTFNLMLKNFELHDTLGGDDNVLLFDIYIQHTNPAASGPFQLALNQYFFNFNPLIANGGELSYKIVPGSTQFSNPNAIPRHPQIFNGNRLDLASNPVLLAGNGPIISYIYPGTRVVKMRLATNALSFAVQPLDLVIRLGPNLPFTKIFAYINEESTEITNNGTYTLDSIIAVPASITLALEGFLNLSSNTLNSKDTVRVYLRNNFPPFFIIDSGKTVIDSINLTGSLIFNNAASGTYYISVKHRNSIETWSKAGGEKYEAGWPFNYNFTTAQTQAYGNNMILKGTKYCIYSGDVIEYGIVDASDLSAVDNDAFNSVSGYVNTDVTGDNTVDASDLSLVDNNAFNSVSVVSPIGSSPGPQTLTKNLNSKMINFTVANKKKINQNKINKNKSSDSKNKNEIK